MNWKHIVVTRRQSRKRKIHLECSECKTRNYSYEVSVNTAREEPLTVKKYCKYCDRHTEHRQAV